MAIFGKQLQAVDPKDLPGRVAALERHIKYMQERIEYYSRQMEKLTGQQSRETKGE